MKIASVKNKGLKLLIANLDATKAVKGIDPSWQPKLRAQIAYIIHEATPMAIVDSGLWKAHSLAPKRPNSYGLWVSGNWRLTFVWDGEEVTDLDLEDYHGKI